MALYQRCGATRSYLVPGTTKVVTLVCDRFTGHMTSSKHQPFYHYNEEYKVGWNQVPVRIKSTPLPATPDPRFPRVKRFYRIKESPIQSHASNKHQPACILCGTWTCHGCWNWRKQNAMRSEVHYCPRCGGRDGIMRPIRHRDPNYHGLPLRVPAPLVLQLVIDEWRP